MTDYSRSADDTQTLAALYALGTLDTQETADLLHTAVPESQDFARVVQALGYAAKPIAPPPSLRGRLLDRLRQPATATPPADAAPALPAAAQPFFLHAHEGSWEAGPFEGTSIRMLFHDTARQYATLLLRIPPGVHIDPHFHVDAEELYVLEGSCSFDSHAFGVGDYVRMPAGTTHNTVISENGCVLLIIASTQTASN